MKRPRVAAELAAALLGAIFDRPGASFTPTNLSTYSLEIDIDGTVRLTTTIVGKMNAMASVSAPLEALLTEPRPRRRLRRRKRRAKKK